MPNNEIINLPVWDTPKNYFGDNPIGDYLIYARNRDSSILEDCNYECILKDLQSIDKNNSVYDFRANHFAYGWVEYILIKKDIASKEVLEMACLILTELKCYPVYNEIEYSNMQYEAITEYWDNCLLDEKIGYCKKQDLSIFSARRLPKEILDILYDEIY